MAPFKSFEVAQVKGGFKIKHKKHIGEIRFTKTAHFNRCASGHSKMILGRKDSLSPTGTGCMLLLASTALLAQSGRPLVLTAESLGPLPLGSGQVVSVPILERAFPWHRVSHEIGGGDSPDFHYFQVTTAQGERLFTIKSFLKQEAPASAADGRQEVSIDLLQVVSRRVRVRFGLRVGNRFADIIRLRGAKLLFGAGHHDVYLGRDGIFYNLATGTDSTPEGLTFADARRGNWRIVSISWPSGAWE